MNIVKRVPEVTQTAANAGHIPELSNRNGDKINKENSLSIARIPLLTLC